MTDLLSLPDQKKSIKEKVDLGTKRKIGVSSVKCGLGYWILHWKTQSIERLISEFFQWFVLEIKKVLILTQTRENKNTFHQPNKCQKKRETVKKP